MAAVGEDGVLLRSVGKPKLTLDQMLAAFEPSRHGGEAMVTGRIGKEIF